MEKIRRELAEKAQNDYHRLKFHIMPESGWLNDPNGLIQYKGKYHAFYQHHPYSPELGPIHWGHVISDDLVHWKYLPFALTPDQWYEMNCFSGSAVDNNGELTLMYTADDETRSPKQVQCIAFSNDGINFTKYENNPVITAPPSGFSEDFRDPKVFMHNDLWYFVAGCAKDNRGGILLYSSQDLRHWDYRGLACKSDGTQGEMWECPDLFKLDDTWVLVISPVNMEDAKCIFITGDMDFETEVFTQKQWHKTDYGLSFYAPQTFLDEKGRRILIGWMDMWGNEMPTQKNGWAGALTFPRELFLKNGEVWQQPVEEINLLRKRKLHSGNIFLNNGKTNNLNDVRGDCIEMKFKIPASEKCNGKLILNLRSSEDRQEKTVLSYDFCSGSFVFTDRQAESRLPSVKDTETIQVHILIDRSSVEIFLYGGKYIITNRIYPQSASIYYDLYTEGNDIAISDLEIWEIDT